MKLQAGLGHTLCLVAALTVGFITAKADTPDPIHLYQLPQQDGATSSYTTSITLVGTSTIIAGSLETLTTNPDATPVSKDDVWVKRGQTDYNVWSDDWSR